eukprot:3445205-Lingulodinium_polyedra.AAC.1
MRAARALRAPKVDARLARAVCIATRARRLVARMTAALPGCNYQLRGGAVARACVAAETRDSANHAHARAKHWRA